MHGVAIRVKGKVQGVGFRPFVWQLAHQLSLCGEVLNDGEGVLIRLAHLHSHDAETLQKFLTRLRCELPPLARIDSLQHTELLWDKVPGDFSIVASQATAMDTQVVPDAATCSECLAELSDPDNRRYAYPFINCTHCGPRFTIITALPYDRPNTVMDAFPLCSACDAEYHDPHDRRYHAQPVACELCGPEVYGVDAQGQPWKEEWLAASVQALIEGKVLAIKSVGGFHLICDATNFSAVQQLRDRKRRQYKPLAVMAADLQQARQLAHCSDAQQAMLTGSIAPILLLSMLEDSPLAANIAPDLNEIGVFLPSNPLQQLLATHFGKPLVMTSGNGSGLPPALDNTTALKELSGIADGFVLHNRDIVQRCDDSLMRVGSGGQLEVLRRSRGLAPDALVLPEGFPDAEGYLAYGGDLKNAFAIGKGRQIIVSQYLGDLSNIETQQQYQQTIEHYISLYQLDITQHVADMHPGYISRQLADSHGEPVTYVQHHHAHVASCLIENGWRPDQGQVLALALDGLGMGDDGSLWGGELFIADYHGYQRIGGLPDVTLVGGDQAARQPWRSFYAHLKSFLPSLGHDDFSRLFPGKPVELLHRAMEKQLNTHSQRSTGRLFDAVAASLGIAFDAIEYEGQAACQLEALATHCAHLPQTCIAIPMKAGELDLSCFWSQWLRLDASREEKAYLFHQSLAMALAQMVLAAKETHGVGHLVLTGGVFHNALLTKLMKDELQGNIQILEHQNYSCGDGGLALGQLAVALCQNKLSNKQ